MARGRSSSIWSKRARLAKSSGRRDPAEGEIVLGQVMAPFSFKGELKIFLYNPAGRWSGERQVVLVDKAGVRYPVGLTLRPGAGKRILGRINGLDDVTMVERYVGATILVAKDSLPALEEGAYYQSDLIGLPVRTVGGRDLGVLAAIHHQGEVDLWEVEGESIRYVPAHDGMILAVEPGVGITVAEEAEDQDAI